MLDAQSYTNVANELLRLCPFLDDPDVYQYAEQRRLIVAGAQAGLGGLPRAELQGEIITKLLETFSAETLARAGLLKRNDDGKPIATRFWCPYNRLIIPWRGLDGSIQILQRRRLDDQKEGKYVFPTSLRPSLPFGAEALRATDVEWPIVFCEGGLDVLALRLIALRDSDIPGGPGVRACDRLGIVPLGLPGLGSWVQEPKPDWARFTRGRIVRIAVDTDDTGNEYVEKIAADCFEAGAARVQRWTPPEGCKDWCETLHWQERRAQ